jgi:hypothetical protein
MNTVEDTIFVAKIFSLDEDSEFLVGEAESEVALGKLLDNSAVRSCTILKIRCTIDDNTYSYEGSWNGVNAFISELFNV